MVEGISQFIKWQHPELNVVELQQRSTPPVARCEAAAGKLLTGVQAAGVAAKPTAAAAPAVLEPSEGGVYEDDQIQVSFVEMLVAYCWAIAISVFAEAVDC